MTTHNIRRGSPVIVLIIGLMAMALSCGGSAAEAPDPQWVETTVDSFSSDQSANGQGRLLGQGQAGAEALLPNSQHDSSPQANAHPTLALV